MQGVTNSLKDGLNLVMGVGAVRHIYMQSDPGVHRKGAPKFLCDAGFIIAAPFLLECGAEHQKRPIGQIQIAPCQALVHRHRKTAVPSNAAKVAQRPAQCLPQHNTGIFYRVMGVYLQVSLHRQLQPKAAVHRKSGKHVIKKTVAGIYSYMPMGWRTIRKIEQIKKELGLDPRVTILGHIQRGGSPTAKDRVTATRMGYEAVQLLAEGKTNRIVCAKGDRITNVDIDEGLAMTKTLNHEEFEVMTVMTGR